jgi:hypothetical protein
MQAQLPYCCYTLDKDFHQTVQNIKRYIILRIPTSEYSCNIRAFLQLETVILTIVEFHYEHTKRPRELYFFLLIYETGTI